MFGRARKVGVCKRRMRRGNLGKYFSPECNLGKTDRARRRRGCEGTEHRRSAAAKLLSPLSAHFKAIYSAG